MVVRGNRAESEWGGLESGFGAVGMVWRGDIGEMNVLGEADSQV